MPEDNTLIYGHRYVLRPEPPSFSSVGAVYGNKHPVPHEAYPKYKYIEPVEYADDCLIGDCWVVDEDGNICPGWNTSPEPFYIGDLVKVHGVRAKHIFRDE